MPPNPQSLDFQGFAGFIFLRDTKMLHFFQNFSKNIFHYFQIYVIIFILNNCIKNYFLKSKSA